MKLSGKCKDDFWEWMNPTGMPSDYKFGQMLGSNFESLPKSMQWGVIQDFAGSVGYDIFVHHDCRVLWSYVIGDVDGDIYQSLTDLKSRKKARTEAIKKFNEIYNSKQWKKEN